MDKQQQSWMPRTLSPDLLWTGGCIKFPYNGEMIHNHANCFVVVGSRKVVIVDTGHLAHWTKVESDVENFLGGRPVDYIFVTHPELPHIGAIRQWLEKYPNAIALGDIRDNDLCYPDLMHRFRMVKVGDRVDLGDRELVFVPALWRDLPTTLWAFETKNRILFVGDAFSCLHFFREGSCNKTTSELPPIDIDLMRYFNEKALSWTQLVDVRPTFAELDRLLTMLQPRMIASAHANVVDNLDVVVPMAKQSMDVDKKRHLAGA